MSRLEVVDEQDWQEACNLETLDDIAGDLPIEARREEKCESYTSWGTAGFPVQNSNGNDRLLTADHLWENESCCSSEGEEATQYTQDFGEVSEAEVQPDFHWWRKQTARWTCRRRSSKSTRHKRSRGWFSQEEVSDLVVEGKSATRWVSLRAG